MMRKLVLLSLSASLVACNPHSLAPATQPVIAAPIVPLVEPHAPPAKRIERQTTPAAVVPNTIPEAIDQLHSALHQLDDRLSSP